MPLLVAELEGHAVQRVPQLQPAVTAAQALMPVPLALPTGPATQLHPTWVGEWVRSYNGSTLGTPQLPCIPTHQ